MGIFACAKRFYTHAARRSHFVFRNNTVCLGNLGEFPVIYRQSDEARQINPSNYFFPSHFSPFGPSSSPQPSLSRLRIGRQKRNGNRSFRFLHLQTNPALLRHFPLPGEACRARARYSHFVFRNNTVCLGNPGGFPVIYRQSDEARQTKPPIISFPLISPLSGDPPARCRLSPGSESDGKKRNGNQPFRFLHIRTTPQGFSCREKSERQPAVPIFAFFCQPMPSSVRTSSSTRISASTSSLAELSSRRWSALRQ